MVAWDKYMVFNNQPFVLELHLWNLAVTNYKSLAAMHDLLCKYSYNAVVWTSTVQVRPSITFVI